MQRATADYSEKLPRKSTEGPPQPRSPARFHHSSPICSPPPTTTTAMPCRVHGSRIHCTSLIDRASVLHANHFLISVVACPACSRSFARPHRPFIARLPWCFEPRLAPQRPSTPWPSATVKLIPSTRCRRLHDCPLDHRASPWSDCHSLPIGLLCSILSRSKPPSSNTEAPTLHRQRPQPPLRSSDGLGWVMHIRQVDRLAPCSRRVHEVGSLENIAQKVQRPLSPVCKLVIVPPP